MVIKLFIKERVFEISPKEKQQINDELRLV